MTDLSLPEIDEIWKPVVGYEGLYEVSNLGRIKSFYKKGKILKQSLDTYGYPIVSLYKDEKKRTKTVHTIVLSSFIGERPNGFVADHKNGKRIESILSNLEYVTIRENSHRGNGTYCNEHNIHYYKKPRSKYGYYIIHISIDGKQKRACATTMELAIEKRDNMMEKHGIIYSGIKNKEQA